MSNDQFSFDPTTLRYRNLTTGRLVSYADIRQLSLDAADQLKSNNRQTTERLLDNSLSVGEWEKQIAQSIKTAHIQQYKLGYGQNMTARDWGIIGRQLRREYGYLRRFSQKIALGMLTEAQIKAQADLYANKTTAIFERGRREGHFSAGANWEKRVLNSSQPCAQCPTFAAFGWQRVGFLPNIGEQCDCRANCLCTFVYSFSTSRPQESLLSGFGWLA